MRSVRCSFLTHTGYFRKGNEDSILVAGVVTSGISMDQAETKEIPALPVLFCVADGIGGGPGGEIASRSVLEFFAAFPAPRSQPEVLTLVSGAKKMLDNAVESSPSLTGLGTTIAGLVILSDTVIVINCGDSRVYQIGHESIIRLSHDHSVVQELCDQGVITYDQMYTHPSRNIITASVIGDPGRPDPRVQVRILPRIAGDRYLLCTDGVWEVLRDETLFSLCLGSDLKDIADRILTACLAGGGPDNISLILLSTP